MVSKWSGDGKEDERYARGTRPRKEESGTGECACSALVFPGTGVAVATPVHSLESYREALAVAVDPETAIVSKHVASTQEGGLHRLPAKQMLTTGLSLICGANVVASAGRFSFKPQRRCGAELSIELPFPFPPTDCH